MRRIKYIIVCFLISTINSFVHSQEIKKVKINELKTLIDTTSTPLILNFWASWCQPCVHEITWFEKNIKQKKDSGSNVQLVLVSMDLESDYPKKIIQFVKQHGITSKIIYLDENNAEYYSPVINLKWDGAVPASLFINKQKNYRHFYEGQITEPRFKLALEGLLK